MCVFVCVCISVCMCMYMYIYVYVCICVYVCMYVCICIYFYCKEATFIFTVQLCLLFQSHIYFLLIFFWVFIRMQIICKVL